MYTKISQKNKDHHSNRCPPHQSHNKAFKKRSHLTHCKIKIEQSSLKKTYGEVKHNQNQSKFWKH